MKEYKKNKLRLLSLLVLSAISLSSLISCSSIKGDKGDTGPTGPTGETGPKGDKGDKGEDGEDGIDGSLWLTGTSKPLDSLGKEGDMYLNTTNGDVYQKESTGWSLKMNIKGEDGEDGKDGLNGLSGSQGKPGETAWSNTVLPSNDGTIIPSLGSQKVGEDITFTFKSDSLDEANGEKVLWTIINKEGNTTNLEGQTITLKMEEGGFVVSAQKVSNTTTIANSEDELKEQLENLKPGENTIILNDEVELEAEDISSISTMSKSKIKTLNNKRDKSSLKTGKIEIYSAGNENITLNILSNGNKKKLKFPFLTIIGSGDVDLRFNNVDLILDFDFSNFDVDEAYTNGFFNFINSKGVNTISFNNSTFSIEPSEEILNSNIYSISSPNFINFDGKSLEFNNFVQNKRFSNFSFGFIQMSSNDGESIYSSLENMNSNLESIKINNSTIYTSVPFNITSFRDSLSLDIEINNSNFYNCKPHNQTPSEGTPLDYLMPFFMLDIDREINKNFNVNIDANNVSYGLYWDEQLDEFPVYLTGGSPSIFVFYSRLDNSYRNNEDGSYNFDESLYEKINENYNPTDDFNDLSLKDKVDISLNNFSLYGEKIKSFDGFEIPQGENILETYHCDVCQKDVNCIDHCQTWKDLYTKKNKPLVTYSWILDFCGHNINLPKGGYIGSSGMFTDDSLYPNLSLNNKDITTFYNNNN